MESLIHHFKLYTEGYHPPVGEAYAAVEGSKGELGFYVISDGSNRPYRWHERPSSFMNLKALEVLAVGRMIADVIGSIQDRDLLDRVFRNADALHEDVASAMQPPLATVEASASVDEIVAALTGRTNAVVVAEEGRPVGVVTRSDLLEYLAHNR